MFSRKGIVIWILITVILCAGILVGKWSLLENVNAGEQSHYTRIKTFAESLSLVKKNYVEDVEEKELVYGAIKGIAGTALPSVPLLELPEGEAE